MGNFETLDTEMIEVERKKLEKFFKHSFNIAIVLFVGNQAGSDYSYLEIRDHVRHKLGLHKSDVGEIVLNKLADDGWIKKNKKIPHPRARSAPGARSGPETTYEITEAGKKLADFLRYIKIFAEIEIPENIKA